MLVAALKARDPDGYAFHKAVRAAVIVPVLFAVGLNVLGNPQLATFAVFGSFALLVFVDFPGSRSGRLGAYLMLALVGAVMITLGTLCARTTWLAVVGMALAAFAILFAGVVSAATAAGARSALLTFILPVTLPGTISDLLPRLAGWAIACAVCIPAVMLVWPPRQHDELRARAAASFASFGRLLAKPGAAAFAETSETMTRLRATFRSSPYRPVGLTTGTRTLVRLVDELEWLLSLSAAACTDDASRWHTAPSPLRASTVAVLDACADVLSSARSEPSPAARSTLRASLSQLDSCLAAEARARVADLQEGGTAELARVFAVHELAYAVSLAGHAVALMGDADARPVLDRLLGRRAGGLVTVGPVKAAAQIAGGHADPHSIWLQNSLRGAAGLALAVLVADVSDVQHGFWVGLGAMSVLRTTALSTGATVLRALVGTFLGFAVGGLLVEVLGTRPAVLWTALPFVVLFAAYAPEAISFLAGQAAFTVTVIILFNLLVPAGWTVGLVRVQDVAYGCAASLVVGALFWPRGAAAGLGRALQEGYELGSAYLRSALAFTVQGGPSPQAESMQAIAAARRLDDAFRQYLAEGGAKRTPLSSVTAAANGASRLRLAADAMVALREPAATGDAAREAAGTGVGTALEGPEHILVERCERVDVWYDDFGQCCLLRADVPAVPQLVPTVDDAFVDGLRRSVATDESSLARAEQLLWTAQYLHDLERLEGKLVAPAADLRAAAARSWWR